MGLQVLEEMHWFPSLFVPLCLPSMSPPNGEECLTFVAVHILMLYFNVLLLFKLSASIRLQHFLFPPGAADAGGGQALRAQLCPGCAGLLGTD